MIKFSFAPVELKKEKGIDKMQFVSAAPVEMEMEIAYESH
jgi:hypothetical protein